MFGREWTFLVRLTSDRSSDCGAAAGRSADPITVTPGKLQQTPGRAKSGASHCDDPVENLAPNASASRAMQRVSRGALEAMPREPEGRA